MHEKRTFPRPSLQRDAVLESILHCCIRQPEFLASLQAFEGALQTTMEKLPRISEKLPGKGIIIALTNVGEYPSAWILVRMLRYFGCSLPIELWSDGTVVDGEMRRSLKPFDVHCLSVERLSPQLVNPRASRHDIMIAAAVHSNFGEMLVLEADSLPVCDPEYLFREKRYKNTGAIFWPACSEVESAGVEGRSHPLISSSMPKVDDGQFLVNKRKAWRALHLAHWLQQQNILSGSFRGSGSALRFAWDKLAMKAAMPDAVPQMLGNQPQTGFCQHDFGLERIFQHRGRFKWHMFARNPRIPGMLFDAECRTFLLELRRRWAGRSERDPSRPATQVPTAIMEELLNTAWIADGMKSASVFGPPRAARAIHAPLRKNGARGGEISTNLPNGLSHETFWGRAYREFTFLRNGTLGESSDKHFQFWDVTMDAGGPILRIHGANVDSEWILRQVRGGEWCGQLKQFGHECELSLRAVERAYPGSTTPATLSHSRPGSASIGMEMRERYGRKLHLINTGLGIGDHVVSLYAASAAASAGISVVFHTRHPRWLARISHPGLFVDSDLSRYTESAIRKGAVIDINRDYTQQIRYGVSRARWYASNIHPELIPERPKGRDREIGIRRIDSSRYAIVAPAGKAANRDWPAVHWQRLINLLQDSGFEVVAIGSKEEERRITEVGEITAAFWAIDHSPEWIIDTLLGAGVVVANDSGIAHLSALLEVPTVGIHAQLSPGFLWDSTSVVGATPDTVCAGCHWRVDRGYVPSICDSTCSALLTISPDRVMTAIHEAISRRAA